MAREILFRARHIHVLPENAHIDGQWVYGYLANAGYIYSPALEGEVLVESKTVCQYTGLTDKTGRKIFEGDIVRRKMFDGYIIGQVVWFDTGFCGFMLKHGNSYYHIGKSEHTGKSDCDEVIGNVYENAYLLKGAK